MRKAQTLTEYLVDSGTELPNQCTVDEAVERIAVIYDEDPEGFTFNLYFGSLSGQSLCVASLYPKRTDFVHDKEAFRGIIRRFIERNMDLLSDVRNNVGGWFDPEVEVTFIDVSSAFTNQTEAEELGKTYNQLSIYCLATGETIPTGGTGEELPGWPPEDERLPPLERGTV